MTKKNDKNMFDPKAFIDSLIEEMGMQNESPEKIDELRAGIEDQMTHVILNTASMNLDSEMTDLALERYKDIDNPTQLFIQLIKYNPEAQVAILNALDELKEQILDAYKTLKK